MTKILFVCHGNICRSVGAQYILKQMVEAAGVADEFMIDSAATSTEEIGDTMYPPMRRTLEKRGVPVGDHRARQITPADYDKNDLIIGMDEENIYWMRRVFSGDPDDKIRYLMAFTDTPDAIIDDPWYTRRFDQCADEITEGCRGLLEAMLAEE